MLTQLLNSTLESKRYENMGFKEDDNQELNRDYLQPMVIYIRGMQGYIEKDDIEGIRTYGREKKKWKNMIRKLEN